MSCMISVLRLKAQYIPACPPIASKSANPRQVPVNRILQNTPRFHSTTGIAVFLVRRLACCRARHHHGPCAVIPTHQEGTMFKHLLLPIDGSELSEAAGQKGVEFAKSINARVTGFYVMPEFHLFTYRTEMVEDTKEEFAKDCRAHANQYLAVVKKAAKACLLYTSDAADEED